MVLYLQTLGVAVTSSAKALPQQCFLWVTLVSFPSLLGKWNMAAVGRWEDVGTHHSKTVENPELVALMHVCPCLSHRSASPCHVGCDRETALAAVFYDSLNKSGVPLDLAVSLLAPLYKNIFKIIAWFVFYSDVGLLPLTSCPFS